MAANEVTYRYGTVQTVHHTPGSAVDGGSVIVIGDIPHIAHRDIAANEKGALAISGGVYDMTAGEAIAAGKKVWWDNTNNKVVETATGNKVMGYLTDDTSASADGDTVRVRHMPDAD